MKFMITISILILLGCKQKKSSPASPLFDETKETAAIMQTIQDETKAFFEGKYEAWSLYWSHDAMAIQAWNNSDGTADVAIGWDQINAQGKNWIERYYKNGKKIIHPDVKTEKPLIRFFNDSTAYLFWKQFNADQDKKHYRISQESRLMQKVNGQWKILNVLAFWDTEPKVLRDSL